MKDEKFKLQLQLEEESLKVQEIQNDWFVEGTFALSMVLSNFSFSLKQTNKQTKYILTYSEPCQTYKMEYFEK